MSKRINPQHKLDPTLNKTTTGQLSAQHSIQLSSHTYSENDCSGDKSTHFPLSERVSHIQALTKASRNNSSEESFSEENSSHSSEEDRKKSNSCTLSDNSPHQEKFSAKYQSDSFILRILLLSIACSLALILALVLTGCHQHQEPIDTQMKIGSILCTDGQTVDYRQYIDSDLQAIGVVFYVNHDPTVAGKGYAVYLRDLFPSAFADTLGLEQGTSKDVYDLCGNENTYALQSNAKCSSPLGQAVFDMWQYGQSAYIPSVGQYRLLYQAKDIVNYYLIQCSGDAIDSDADKCWYWSSTEVDGQSKDKAWLFSLSNGTYQETPKDQAHKSRPIITIY